jgi:hypothetical protein
VTRECFCGCGREISRKLKTLNRVGAAVEVEVDEWEYTLKIFRADDPSGRFPNLETWAKTAREFRNRLRQQVHAAVDEGIIPPHDEGRLMAQAAAFAKESREAKTRAQVMTEGHR